MADSVGDERKDYELKKETELRLEVDENQQVVIRLDAGTAEVFGSELARGKEYKLLSRSKVAVFTCFVTDEDLHGRNVLLALKLLLHDIAPEVARYIFLVPFPPLTRVFPRLVLNLTLTKKVMGRPGVAYVSAETPNIMYLNLHVAIDQRRFEAERENKLGPKIVVCGQTDVGKSTLCRLVLNYAVRMGRRPLFVDLDIGQGSISIPGSMGMAEVDRVADVVEGFHELVPIVFHYGHLSPDGNEKLYRALTSTLAMTFEKRCEVNKTNKYSGCVVNTCGWVDGLGYKILEYACLAFDANLVLVIDNERLLYDLKRNLPEGVTVLHLPKSGGVVQRSRTYRKESRKEAVREYFYGKLGGTAYFPYSFDVAFSEVQLYKIGGIQDQEHLLPSGHKKKDRSLQLSPLEPSKELTHHILSVSMAESVEEDVVKTNSAGFLLVTSVDMEKNQMTVLSPAPKPLPRTLLILSDVTYMDIQ